MQTVGLLINETKPAAVDAARDLARYLATHGVATVSQDAVATLLSDTRCEAVATKADVAAQSDFVVVFGGDGTLLAACRAVAPFGKPILSAHLGHFGFLTQTSPEGLRSAVDRVLFGDAPTEERGMLAVSVLRAGAGAVEPCDELLAMNDVAVASGAVRLIYVQTRVDGELLATYAADGVIVATPTGSTGYSLSAGGPLVHPSAPVFVVSPICPHTLSARPLIIPDTQTVELSIEPHRADTVGVASVDGQVELALAPGDTVRVSASPHRVRFLVAGDAPSFYEKIRTRWHYAERANA
ncbi:MAG: NAD(+)/NADH kinase [Armatimonadetes bacterium]|nr:NAD(+)/NADH kinase [Armatimonadota bacterium]